MRLYINFEGLETITVDSDELDALLAVMNEEHDFNWEEESDDLNEILAELEG